MRARACEIVRERERGGEGADVASERERVLNKKLLGWEMEKNREVKRHRKRHNEKYVTDRAQHRNLAASMASDWRAEDPGIKPRVPRLSHTSDIKIGTLVATLQGAWWYRVGYWLAWCQYTVTGWDSKFDQQTSISVLQHECLSRSVYEIHQHVAGTLSKQPTTKFQNSTTRVTKHTAGISTLISAQVQAWIKGNSDTELRWK